MILPAPELASVALEAGFSIVPTNEVTYVDRTGATVTTLLSDAVMAVAIALSESPVFAGTPPKLRGSDSNAIGVSTDKASPNYGQVDLGCWQISDRWHNGKLIASNWRDPRKNAAMAYEIKTNRGSWVDWSVFNSGAYTANIEMAIMAVLYPVPPPRWPKNY